MKVRLGVPAFAVAAALILLGGVCGRRLYPPEFISVPDSVYAGETALVRLATSGRGYDSVRYVVNWDDATDTTVPFGLSDTATVWHIWTVTGTKQVRAAVYSLDDPQGIRWAAQQPVVVEAGGLHAPVIDTVLLNQGVAVRGAASLFTVKAHDPDGDSLRLKFDWGAAETTTAYFASPCSISVSHVFTQVETAVVVISAQDIGGATSLPDTVLIPVGTAGGVKWYRQGFCWTSPLVASDGSDECVYCSVAEDPEGEPIFRALGATGQVRHTYEGSSTLTDEPACCATTGHIIMGSYEGELVALSMHLDEAWYWLTMWWQRWGPMAITGARIYVRTEADGYDSTDYFIDSITSGARVAAFLPSGHVIDAPVVDVQGNVYFGTDSGYLCRMGPELDTVLWRTRLLANGKIHSPIVGRDGTIYCGSDSSRLHAVSSDGEPIWAVTFDGVGVRPALGQSALFVGTENGTVCSVNPATGSINWRKTLTQNFGFYTTPIVAANGYLYIQDDNDVLYALNQADGTLIWACDCNMYLPGGGRVGKSPRLRELGLLDYDRNPTITSTGDIIIAGQAALFCVSGYSAGPLDPLAQWPKWQHDLHNTGYVSGGR